MAVFLRGAGGDFVWNNRGWAMLVHLAWDHGWRPVGTLPPTHWGMHEPGAVPGDWPRADYVTGRGQRVREDDARNLAEALERCVDDLPNHDALAEKGIPPLQAPAFPVWRHMESGASISPFEVFGGPNKDGFRRFIAFCRAGGFTIW
ncbi:MAG: hypothetical protein EA378_05535 [Phycisphaerales bacterium]|nr:MAG: hypothetical protein EA378_05535 [Phycisphaerales bacterium]